MHHWESQQLVPYFLACPLAISIYGRTHLVEIDLLRDGDPLPMMGDAEASPYRISPLPRHQRNQILSILLHGTADRI